MPFEIQPVGPNDLEPWARLFYRAFRNTTVSCLWRREPSDASYSKFANARGAALLENDPTVYMLKVIDTDLPDDDAECKRVNGGVGSKMVAVGYWKVYDTERTLEEVQETLQLPATYPEDNRPARTALMSNIWIARLKYQLHPHITLETLVTHPLHQRRGAGALIVDWGCRKADELGLLGYLEGSSGGKGLYKKYGFEEKEELVTDLTMHGGDVDRHVAMLRQPRQPK